MNLPNRNTRFILNTLFLLTVSVALFWGLALTVSAQLPSDYGLEATANAAKLPVGNPSPAKLAATIVNALLGTAGDEQKISKAKKLLGSAIVGLAIVLAAYAIASFTISNLQKGAGTSNGGSGGVSCTTPEPDPNLCNGEFGWDCVNGVWECT
ncbi:MAG: hypothetical protein UW00_C0014G0009 [Parcubacteria group bacterium GW2011_GWB1_43_66]|nr:MAG: hypothetical protein UW00_C0014G0009 [Parcubacteria group bacterium GW2011_GWB1_43_66]